MKEIREGLEKNLDISFYANSKYNWEQMFHIKDGLEENLDVSIYDMLNQSLIMNKWNKLD